MKPFELIRFTPLKQQQELAVAKLLPTRVGGLLMDMGTGKTLTTIELARLRQHKWDRLFWFCPVSGKETILHEWLKHTNLTANQIMVFDHKTSTDNLPTNYRIYIVGVESMSSSDRVVMAYSHLITEDSFVIVDESHYIKGHRSKRTQRITYMNANCRYRLILTGTAFTQGAVDLYSQMTFLSPKILGYRSFWSFAANHLEYEVRKDASGRKFKTGRIVRSHNEEYLASKMAPYVYQVKKDECLSLPEKLYETRICSMSSVQEQYYEQAKEEILLKYDYEDWSSTKIFHLFTTLQSIVCGFWNREDPDTKLKELIHFRHNRINLLMGVLNEIAPQEKVIIWGKYHHAISQIVTSLAEVYGEEQIAQYHGKLTIKERSAQLARWRKDARFLVATQDTGGQVHTFNEAAYSIFYADSFKYDRRLQAEDRNHRIGQTRRPVYVTLQCARSIDDRISSVLARKGNALTEFQKQIDIYKKDKLRQMALDLVRAL